MANEESETEAETEAETCRKGIKSRATSAKSIMSAVCSSLVLLTSLAAVEGH